MIFRFGRGAGRLRGLVEQCDAVLGIARTQQGFGLVGEVGLALCVEDAGEAECDS